jgi:prevent-host-death family protein
MATVGVRELKNRLSHYIKLARDGERIVITERGKPVAEIGPSKKTDIEILQELAAQGKVRWSGGKPDFDFEPFEMKGKPLSDIIIEQRGEW